MSMYILHGMQGVHAQFMACLGSSFTDQRGL